MSTNFPSSLDTYATLVDNVDDVLAAHQNDRGDAIEALQAKVGVNNSAVSSSHDYKLRHLPTQEQNWDAGSFEIRAETFESDVATGTPPLVVASTTKVDNLNADLLDGLSSADYVQIAGVQTVTGNKTFSGTNTHSGANDFQNSVTMDYVLMDEHASSPTVGANQGSYYTKDVGGITEAHYKDSAGNAKQLTSAGNINYTVPDGAITRAKLATALGEVTVAGTSGGVSCQVSSGASISDSYLTYIYLSCTGGSANNTLPGGEYGFWPQLKVVGFYGGQTMYAQQRYVTASGIEPWLFVLTDENRKVKTQWYASDHPSYGQGGDEYTIPHPFGEYLNIPLPDGWEITLLDVDSIRELESKRVFKKDLTGQPNPEAICLKGVLEAFNQEYLIDWDNELQYVPRDISDNFGNHKDVESIPGYIKVRRIKRI